MATKYFIFNSPPQENKNKITIRKDGYNLVVSPNHDIFQSIRDELSIPSICPQCGQELKGNANKKIYILHNKCINCLAIEETQLKIEGKYESYELEKMKKNLDSWVKDGNDEIEKLINMIENPYEQFYETGITTKFDYYEDKKVLIKKIKTKWKQYKKEIQELFIT